MNVIIGRISERWLNTIHCINNSKTNSDKATQNPNANCSKILRYLC